MSLPPPAPADRTGAAPPGALQPAAAADERVLEDLDERWEIACEFELDERTACGAVAAWWFRCRACGSPLAMCEEHRREQLAAFRGFDGFIFCSRCGARGHPHRWRDLFSVTPIEGRP